MSTRKKSAAPPPDRRPRPPPPPPTIELDALLRIGDERLPADLDDNDNIDFMAEVIDS